MTMSVLMNILMCDCEWICWWIMNGWSKKSTVHDGTMNGFHDSCWICFFSYMFTRQSQNDPFSYIYILNILTTIDNLLIHWLYWPSPWSIPPAGSSAVLPPRTAALHWAAMKKGHEKGLMALGSHRESPVKTIKKQFIIGIPPGELT